MTTMVRVLNEGPSKIRVTSISSDTGQPDANSYTAIELAPGELSRPMGMYIYTGRSVRIDEVKDEPEPTK